MFPSPHSQSRLLFKSFMPGGNFFLFLFIFCDVYMTDVHLASSWSCHTMSVIISKNRSGFLLHLHSLTEAKWIANIYKKWRVIIFFKQIWFQAVGLPKSFMSYLNFLIPDQTQPRDEKSIFQSFLFQLFWEVGINGNEICGNECTLLFRPELLYSLLFLLYLMYPKLTKKLDNKILNPKKIGDWEQLTFLDYNTFLQKNKHWKV